MVELRGGHVHVYSAVKLLPGSREQDVLLAADF